MCKHPFFFFYHPMMMFCLRSVEVMYPNRSLETLSNGLDDGRRLARRCVSLVCADLSELAAGQRLGENAVVDEGEGVPFG